MIGKISQPKSSDHHSPLGFRWRSYQKLWALLLGAVVLLMSTGCLWLQFSNLGGETTGQTGSSVTPYQLSETQIDLLSQRGDPQAFTLLFYQQQEADGSLGTVRQEVWDYYREGESYTFVNGELDSFEVNEIRDLTSLAPQLYSPQQFTANMTLEDVLVASGLEDFIEVPLEKEFLDGGTLYYGQALSFGLVDGRLRYLEALAIMEE